MKARIPLLLPVLGAMFAQPVTAQHSVAQQWNEQLLNSIRKDFARPTVHARNLFHVSAAMYDAWAAYDDTARPWLLGDTVGTFVCPFIGVPAPANIDSAREEAISYAAYRMIIYRFKNAPGKTDIYAKLDSVLLALGYDKNYTSVDYWNGNPAALGNYIAQCYIAFGQQDGANEGPNLTYSNQYYVPRSPTLLPVVPGNPDCTDPNLWQPLTLDVFIDQSGNVIPLSTPPFLSPEWGNVVPFSLDESDNTVYVRDSHNYYVYHDPGPPPLLDTLNQSGLSDEYKWTFELVATWSSHLDPSDSVMWDISPGGIGNIPGYPTDFVDHKNFYDKLDGGDPSLGYSVNPATGLPYAPQIVPRGDYTRVLAEFWADGPSSETPPGHWFTILNYVHDHPQFQRRWKGQGPIMDDLEWCVKSYFALGGAMHDVAISVWGMKGWYDYARPITAIRYMCDQGQSSDSTLPHYSPNGITLIPGYIELVDSLDPLVGASYEHLWKIKIKMWKGPDYINDPLTDVAGVDWLLGENWWPYQRPTFVTPPFAGYVSGHSTYSRGAAELMTLLTGDPYFPGGMGEFQAPMNEFLVFEDGPSVDLTLQWAKYVDASDQCSLSRIWGGIHPPADDINGRHIGMEIGPEAFLHAETYFDAVRPGVIAVAPNLSCVSDAHVGNATFEIAITFDEEMDTTISPVCAFPNDNISGSLTIDALSCQWTNTQRFLAVFDVNDADVSLTGVDVRLTGARDVAGNEMDAFDAPDNFVVDTRNPEVISIAGSPATVTDDQIGSASFSVGVTFDEPMNTSLPVNVSFPNEDPLAQTLTVNSSGWVNPQLFVSTYNVANSHETLLNIDVEVSSASDNCDNALANETRSDVFSIVLTPSGLEEFSRLLQIYPNPVHVSQPLTVTLDRWVDGTIITVFDLQGRELYTRAMTAPTQTVELVAMQSGLYLVQVVSPLGQASVPVSLLR